MNEPKEYRFNEIAEFLDIDEETFARMIPDLIAYHEYSRTLKGLNLPITISKFIWMDDDRAGELSKIEIVIGKEV